MAEIATIDVVRVEIDGVALTTASQIQVEPQIETTDAIKLIVKGRLIAQKREIATLTGNTITLTDNVFNPQLVAKIMGGTATENSYTPPDAGEDPTALTPFDLTVYSAQYDTSGLIVKYEKIVYPNCTGQPISISSQDDVFRVMEYTIISAPAAGEPPYTIEYINSLPSDD